jgi:hypothetical protein
MGLTILIREYPVKTEYKEGSKVLKEFERTMVTLFRAPKPTERKKPKAPTERKTGKTDKD